MREENEYAWRQAKTKRCVGQHDLWVRGGGAREHNVYMRLEDRGGG